MCKHLYASWFLCCPCEPCAGLGSEGSSEDDSFVTNSGEGEEADEDGGTPGGVQALGGSEEQEDNAANLAWWTWQRSG